MISCRMKIAAIVGVVCVGASIAIAAFLMFYFTRTVQHDAAGASLNTHITTNGNCVTNESIVRQSISKLLVFFMRRRCCVLLFFD